MTDEDRPPPARCHTRRFCPPGRGRVREGDWSIPVGMCRPGSDLARRRVFQRSLREIPRRSRYLGSAHTACGGRFLVPRNDSLVECVVPEARWRSGSLAPYLPLAVRYVDVPLTRPCESACGWLPGPSICGFPTRCGIHARHHRTVCGRMVARHVSQRASARRLPCVPGAPALARPRKVGTTFTSL
jgi:hypothetical protein